MNGELQSIKSGAFFITKLKNISIPDSVRQISGFYDDQVIGGPFGLCIFLTNIFISENSALTRIGYAVSQKSPVTNIFIPKDCRIDAGAFNLMANLSVTIDSRNQYHRIYNKCIYSYDYNSFYWASRSYTDEFKFYPNCSIIAFEAFRGYSTKYALVIPPSIIKIDVGSFREFYCKSIIFQNYMIQTPNFQIFAYNYSPIIMPSILKVVHSRVFDYYFGKCIEFFSDIERIDSDSFTNCSELQEIRFHKLKNNLIIDSNSFRNCANLKYLIFPIESTDIITFNSTCLDECDSFIGVKFYMTIPRDIMKFNVSTKSLDIDVSTANKNGDPINCGRFQLKHPFDEKCKVPIHSCKRSPLSLNIPNIFVFICIIIE
ncbi:hypothetical protein TVAG_495520 [Trichomonas vaginalis G3]|uniref:Surface antigen BspA-like n=1 Tax=Trichomonas vaginalis (strain ATCC PRA-98 / G3) TaxID=412133 RepID=A2DVJ5_TRIV3|nr:BspA type Leucine rich repeat region (6 copies) family [Trichomonas vaginalis G3]EAY15537.1 hypothetical protein TVAG_495520 [Trichomonas vaginalis G3]KAI5526183.1 BspA type Leucine rich repeat region (6 copies) family [Trichomonas vaginalis G3]|eukprot:XP_001327760.1 hypothetical protein [Trichomonas vaginalis G3]